MHVSIEQSVNVEAFKIVATSPQPSPNTDGIHVTSSENVQIIESVITTGKPWEKKNSWIMGSSDFSWDLHAFVFLVEGDDCISIVNAKWVQKRWSHRCNLRTRSWNQVQYLNLNQHYTQLLPRRASKNKFHYFFIKYMGQINLSSQIVLKF